MRINEDYLDDINIDDEVSVSLTADKKQNGDYERIFTFKCSELPKHRKIEWYTSKIVSFRQRFKSMLDRLPIISDYNEDFPVNIGTSGITKRFVPLEGSFGFEIMHPDYSSENYDITSDSNMVWFSVGMNVRMNTLEQLRRVLMNLWLTFSKCYTDVFGNTSEAKQIYYHNPDSQKFYINMDRLSFFAWKQRSEKYSDLFLNALRCLYPDKKPRQLKEQVGEFIGRGKSDATELIKQWRTELFGYYDNNILNKADKIDVQDGKLIIYHPGYLELNQQYIRVMFKKPIQCILKGLKKIVFVPFLSIYSEPDDYFPMLKEWIEKFAPDVDEIQVSVDGDSLFPYANKTVDLEKMFPGISTEVKKRQKTLLTYHTSKPRSADGAVCRVPRKDFNVTFITAQNKQTFRVIVAIGV